MTAIAMPKFAIKKLDVTDEQFAIANENKGNKFLGPGQHDVKIKEVLPQGPSVNKITGEGDPTWYVFRVVYVGANGAEISDFIRTPTTKLTYASKYPKGATFPLLMVGDFFRAIGEDFVPSKCNDLLVKYFGSNKLVGKELTIQVGYKGTHAAYDASNKCFILADKDGRPVDGSGALTFSSRDEAKAYCLQNNIRIEAFPNVTAYVPGEVVEDIDVEDSVSF